MKQEPAQQVVLIRKTDVPCGPHAHYWLARCPLCGTPFLLRKEDARKQKSCGCLKRCKGTTNRRDWAGRTVGYEGGPINYVHCETELRQLQ